MNCFLFELQNLSCFSFPLEKIALLNNYDILMIISDKWLIKGLKAISSSLEIPISKFWNDRITTSYMLVELFCLGVIEEILGKKWDRVTQLYYYLNINH